MHRRPFDRQKRRIFFGQSRIRSRIFLSRFSDFLNIFKKYLIDTDPIVRLFGTIFNQKLYHVNMLPLDCILEWRSRKIVLAVNLFRVELEDGLGVVVQATATCLCGLDWQCFEWNLNRKYRRFVHE